jgi:hypothetical protein
MEGRKHGGKRYYYSVDKLICGHSFMLSVMLFDFYINQRHSLSQYTKS